MNRLTPIALLLAMLASPAAYASDYEEETQEGEGYWDGAWHGRHTGFFVRLTTGIGFTSASGSFDQGPDADLSSLSDIPTYGDFAIGGAIAENLILHATLGGLTANAPNLTIGGQDVNTNNIDLNTFVFGGGVTYYIMPANIYASASLGFSLLSLSGFNDDAQDTSATGLGGSALVGKEWWVSDNWGVGVAGMLQGGRVSGDINDVEATWTYLNVGVVFSGTYN